MKLRSLFLIQALCLLCAFSPSGAQRQADPSETDPYLAFSGPAYPWPAGQRFPLTLSVKTYVVEAHALDRVVVDGGVKLTFSSPGPFRLVPVQSGYSASLQDNRTPTGYFNITWFNKGEFIPSVSDSALMGYAKALRLSSTDNRIVEVVEGPDTEIPRGYLYLGERPRLITWRVTLPATKQTFLRTDYFIEREDGILVATVTGSEADHSATRAAAEDLMRFGHFGHPE